MVPARKLGLENVELGYFPGDFDGGPLLDAAVAPGIVVPRVELGPEGQAHPVLPGQQLPEPEE